MVDFDRHYRIFPKLFVTEFQRRMKVCVLCRISALNIGSLFVIDVSWRLFYITEVNTYQYIENHQFNCIERQNWNILGLKYHDYK